MNTLNAGDAVGPWYVRYTIEEGWIWLVTAYHGEQPDRFATLQVFPNSTAARLRANAHIRSMKAVGSPHFPELIDSGTTEDHIYLVYEPFDALPLSHRMMERPGWNDVGAWLFGLATALQQMHAKGWAHRGLTPESVYVDDDRHVWLLGLAAATDDHRQRARLPKRNMAYVAPEVLTANTHDAVRADLYAFGCVAYELLSGEPAFPAATWVDQAHPQQLLLEWKTKVSALDPGPDHPAWVRSFVMKCTHPDPVHRLPDIDTVVAWLESSRATWETQGPAKTPVSLPRGYEPTLKLHPNFSPPAAEAPTSESLAAAQQSRYNNAIVAAAWLGFFIGALLAMLTVLYVELNHVMSMILA